MKRMTGGLALCALLGMGGLACGDKPGPTRRPDAAAVTATPDAATRPPPRRRMVSLAPDCRCAPPPVSGPAAKVVREALVSQMDLLNRGLRKLMSQIDQAVPDEQKDRLTQPAPLQAAHRALVCRVDCLLYRFSGATEALWSYLAVAARFLDEAQRALARLAAHPQGRPAGPSIARLTELFNLVARTSNESIGLALFTHRTPLAQVGVDASTFKSKTRRWQDGLRVITTAFVRRWLPLVERRKPEGPALVQPLRLRVALTRLRQQLARLLTTAQAIACKRGQGCAKPQSHWDAVQTVLRALGDHLALAERQLRAARPTITLSAGRRLSDTTTQAFSALRKAAIAM